MVYVVSTDGWRYQGFVTNTPTGQLAFLEARLMLAQIAADLTDWTRLLALSGDAAALATCEPQALRHRLLHVPAWLVHRARRRHLRSARRGGAAWLTIA